MENKETHTIYFNKCDTFSIENANAIKKIKKYFKKSKMLYIFVDDLKNQKNLNQEIFNMEGMYKTTANVIYNASNKKAVNNKIVFSIEITQINIKLLQNYIEKYMIEAKQNNRLQMSFVLCKNERALIEIDYKHAEIIVSSLKKHQKYIAIGIISIAVLLIMIKLLVIIIIPKNISATIGIIDGNYSITYDNVIYNKEAIMDKSKLTHGDEMLEFANKVSKNLNIYYYDASNENNVIDTDNVVKALNYMKEKGVTKVNLSISSKRYSVEIENWIKENSQIKVFASYNNLINSIDYPAMYEGIYGSGKKVDIPYKDIDYTYFNNTLAVFPNILKIYKGNSYLSLYNAITK